MKLQEKALKIVDALEKEYPGAVCSLSSANALELLIATRLSAQCTDERVNIVTKGLFRRYRSAEDFAQADLTELEGYIHSCGLYKTKARDIRNMCRMLLEQYGGKVPGTLEELIKLPGVGRKTANLIVGDIFGQPSFVVDTHCARITGRLGLVKATDPYKIEMELRKIIPPEKSGMFCHRLVLHGRAKCRARGPLCAECCLREWCSFYAGK